MRMPEPTGGDFAQAPEGTHQARCYRVIDLGTQQITWQGQSKLQHKILLSWELPTELTEDGAPFTVHQRYTFSSHEKAIFRQHLESWRGKKFVDSDFGPGGFEIANLLGVPCLISIVHAEKEGKTYANISAIMKLPKGMDVPELTNRKVFLSLERGEFSQVEFDGLPEGLQDTIRKSPEYIELMSGPGDGQQFDDDMDQDIPF